MSGLHGLKGILHQTHYTHWAMGIVSRPLGTNISLAQLVYCKRGFVQYVSAFENLLRMRKPDKPSLARHLIASTLSSPLPAEVKYVVDGGALPHRVRWMKRATFDDVLKQYTLHCLRSFALWPGHLHSF